MNKERTRPGSVAAKASIQDIAYALPERVVTNAELAEERPEWDMKSIEERAGVRSRHIAADGETALDLSVRACGELFERVDGLHQEVDALLCCTQSPDYIMPPNSCVLHQRLELADAVMCFDFNLACSGFVYGLAMAQALIGSGMARNVLLVTGDTYSKYINARDRSSRVLFGDGAAATLLGCSENEQVGVLDILCSTSGKDFQKFIIPAGGMREPRNAASAEEHTDSSGNVRCRENIHMDGLGVLTFASSKIPGHVRELLDRNQLTLDDIDRVIFHQASKLAIDTLMRLLKIPEEKGYTNLLDVGNLVSASIPVALQDARDAGAVQTGDRVLLVGFGVGLSYASAIVDM